MHAIDITDRWAAKTLTCEQIRIYLENDVFSVETHYDADAVSHVAECCYHIYLWATHQLPAVGSFLTAVIDNDLMKSVNYADGTNRDLLWVYVIFLYNTAPARWRERSKQ